MFALKVLKKDHVIKRNQVEHTKTERNVLSALGAVRHPFIVGLHMAFQSKEKLYFVLDYCPGGELFFTLVKLEGFPSLRRNSMLPKSFWQSVMCTGWALFTAI